MTAPTRVGLESLDRAESAYPVAAVAAGDLASIRPRWAGGAGWRGV